MKFRCLEWLLCRNLLKLAAMLFENNCQNHFAARSLERHKACYCLPDVLSHKFVRFFF